ncbi:hypothetical protein F3Y22_tig00110610pilonHSYRG00044 [Hibiscus syriacus]|uniref:Reverse transcriptase zinc-binding domain-containing protein n=1 Tax=Hibiscus syriacus TaxID=106335 RepID=A0A6A3A3B5_HIBSY|nr:hypothetical protein F3Y22_tig00110610pilonHSYRG00044 [Hibiscus syriacus]
MKSSYKTYGPIILQALSINAPKVVECLGSDGHKYKQLAKSGKDDLRQDAVVPFTPSTGVLEWVDGTLLLGEYLKGRQVKKKTFVILFLFDDRKKTSAKPSRQFVRTSGLNFGLPVMHYFFLERFLQPADWFEKRLAYTRSVAATSMLTESASSSYSFKRLLKLKTEALPIFNAGVMNSKGIWEEIRVKRDKVPCHKLIWFPLHILKFSIITWLAILDRLPTRERLIRMGITTVGSCVLCNDALESRNHLFADCAMAASLWKEILNLTHLAKYPMSWDNMLAWASTTWKGKSLLTSIMKIAWCAFIYIVWEERNKRLFQGRVRTVGDMLSSIKETVGTQPRNRDLNRLDNVNTFLCNKWGIG